MRQLLVLLSCFLLAPLQAGDAPAITIEVDARDLPRRLVHTKVEIPCQPGTLRLWYPLWFPGSHGPHGRMEDVGGFWVETSDGRPLAWKRDEVNLHCVEVQIPEGLAAVRVKLDTICNFPAVDAQGIYTYGNKNLGVINWNTCLIYPEGPKADEQPVNLRVRLPEKWKLASALKAMEPKDGVTPFETVTLTKLVDNPLIAGEHLRTIKLDTGTTPPAFMHLIAESPKSLELSDKVIAMYSKLVREAVALFGVAHYTEFHFLVTCSNELGMYGLEHLGCSLNGVMERSLIDDNQRKGWIAMLIPHEYAHSWCGKYRRPAGMVTPNFHTPQKTRLLWVYEGMTQYLGDVLMVRCGLVTPEEYQKTLAGNIRDMSRKVGRNWRSLEDTGSVSHLLRRPSRNWPELRRDQDFYYEGMLLWLECDAIIREKTGGAKSLDDFCKIFFAAVPGKKTVAEYELSDVIAALNQVLPYEWESFVQRHVSVPMSSLPVDFMEKLGYRVSYIDKAATASSSANNQVAQDSLGVTFSSSRVGTVLAGTPADKAGITTGMIVQEVNGKKFSVENLREAIAESPSKKSVEFAVKEGETTRKYVMPYADGLRFFNMSRIEGKPDVLAEILKPLGK